MAGKGGIGALRGQQRGRAIDRHRRIADGHLLDPAGTTGQIPQTAGRMQLERAQGQRQRITMTAGIGVGQPVAHT